MDENECKSKWWFLHAHYVHIVVRNKYPVMKLGRVQIVSEVASLASQRTTCEDVIVIKQHFETPLVSRATFLCDVAPIVLVVAIFCVDTASDTQAIFFAGLVCLWLFGL